MFNFLRNGNMAYGIGIGIGAAFLLPVASRLVAGVSKPLIKESIRGSMYLYDTGKAYMAEAWESFEDLSAEVKTEMQQEEKAKAETKSGASKSSSQK